MRRGLFLAVALAALLAACSSASTDELQQWMIEQRNATRTKVDPIPEPQVFVPQAYDTEAQATPFSADRLLTALKGEKAASASTALVAPELSRRKEALESIPLDAITMVGLLDKGGQKVALVRADRLLYQVRLGNYMGQNFGRITRITENEIALREIVQDGAGEWMERQASLQLQEVNSK